MAIPAKNILGNPNVTEGSFQIAIEQLRESVIGSGKVYNSANTYMAYDICEYSGVIYYSKIDNNIGNTPSIGANWGDYTDLLLGVVHKTGDETIAGVKTFSDNVGIGVTPSAWGSMGNVTAASVGSSNIQFLVGANSYYNSGYKYASTGIASQYEQGNGIHYWKTAPSGTAGNPITWNTAMTLGSNGNLLVGTTTDNGVDRLQVNGSVVSKRRSGASSGDLLGSNTIIDSNPTVICNGNPADRSFILEIINPNSGITCIPFYPAGGTGVKYVWTAITPFGTIVNNAVSQDIVISFTEPGELPNTYTITLSGGSAILTIQATVKNSSFSVYATAI